MDRQTAAQLAQQHCRPCEGGVAPVSADEAAKELAQLPGWTLAAEGRAIRKPWTMKNFMAAIDFFQAVARVAEAEGHHPDLHLTGYRNVVIELTTHAIGGLSENDFILAAKIDELPVRLKA